MNIPYANIFNAAAIRAGMLTDGTPAELEAAYVSGNLVDKVDSTEVPYSALRRDILAAEREIAELIAFSNNSFYRAALGTGQSDAFAHHEAIPAVDANDKEFIGKVGGVFDAETGRALTETKKDEIYRYLMEDAASSFFTIPVYKFALDGDRVITTVPSVYVTGVIWDAGERANAFDSDGDSLLPSPMENHWLCKVLSRTAQEGWFIAESGFYAREAMLADQDLKEGKVRQITLPQIGVKTASADISD